MKHFTNHRARTRRKALRAVPLAIAAFVGLQAIPAHAGVTQMVVPEPVTVRIPLKQPFSSSSIWNHPIGARAVYVPANIPAVPGSDIWAPMPQIDDEIIVLRSNAPVTTVYYNDAAWTGNDRCVRTSSTVIAQVPVPDDYVVPNSRKNNSAVFLKPDGRTLVHMQPYTRCSGMAPTALLAFNTVDLYGDGIEGSHGGSKLSAIGGSLRVGEFRPATGAVRHALKMNVYGDQMLGRCQTRAECFTWPARGADSDAVGRYGTKSSNAPSAMKMGALLAIPPSNDINKMGLETQPGKMLAWTLQNYGAYIVDDTGGPGIAFSAENGPDGSFRAQFKADWGYEFEQRVRDNTPWVRDMQRIVKALNVVTNNSATTIGGGGTPMQPLAPQLSAPNEIATWKSIVSRVSSVQKIK